MNNNNKSIYKAQNRVRRDYSKRVQTHARTHARTHTHTHAHTQSKTGRWKTAAREQKTWQAYSLGKRNIFTLHLSKSRQGFCLRGRGWSFNEEHTCSDPVFILIKYAAEAQGRVLSFSALLADRHDMLNDWFKSGFLQRTVRKTKEPIFGSIKDNNDRHERSLSPNLHTPFSPSLISLMVSVDVKHHVYLLTLHERQ